MKVLEHNGDSTNIEVLANYGNIASRKGISIVEITSKWCSSCKGLTVILQKLRDEGLINFLKINIDKNPSITQKLDIKTIPAIFFFKIGFLLNRDIEIYDYPFVKKGIMTGVTSENLLKEIIKLV
ncbi:MAG: thioredoxin family protein [Candidatus Lokiarchaeota archaeon]|nr:thioredoxin family protein [Candidatus Lokiarchaeota archaeon]